ncbi:luciferin 4-monooxygenase isoform X3 [Daphnia magna]|uniref:luciferin 4-monooxygenase isoform X3 n=1 Tax=Daphnia magna TaxID=35525 RepID=UPI001E1BA0CC|nr:luciferin 4-monooxygenase isoform X3 [Daphnia magna]
MFVPVEIEADPKIQTYQDVYDNSIPDAISVSEFILQRIVSNERVACVNAETKQFFTYNQIKENSYALATGLQTKFNLKRGDNVAIILPNCLEYPVVIFAVMLTGGCATLINPAQTISELEHSFRLAKPKLCIGTEDCIVKFEGIYKDLSKRPPFVLLNALTTSHSITIENLTALGKKQTFQQPTIDTREDAALILFSSGTTGIPKGVVLTHFNLIAARRQTQELAKAVRRRDPQPSGTIPVAECLAAVLPFYHTYGISGVFDNLMGGLRFVIIPNFSLHLFLQAVQDYKITVVSLVPAIAVQLAKQPVEHLYDLSSLRVIRSGASALSADTINDLKRKLNCTVYQGYGMTEATVRSHANFKGVNREGSIGVVMPFCECKVMDRDTHETLGPNQEGEICVRGPIVMKGYVGDAEATRATIDSQGWLHTGDVGYYDEEGYFFITDRMKELIKYKGLQVSPTELERILLTHPDVVDVAVAPIADPSAGEIPRAYIVKRQGGAVTSDELARFLSDKVSAYKRLRGGVVFIDAVPKTSTGKIVRRALTAKTMSKLLSIQPTGINILRAMTDTDTGGSKYIVEVYFQFQSPAKTHSTSRIVLTGISL